METTKTWPADFKAALFMYPGMWLALQGNGYSVASGDDYQTDM